MPETSFSGSVDDTEVVGRVPAAQSRTHFTDMWRRTLSARALPCSTAARPRQKVREGCTDECGERENGGGHQRTGSFTPLLRCWLHKGPPGKSNDPGSVLWGCSHLSASRPPTSATGSPNERASISCSLRGITLSFVKRNLTTCG